MTLRMGPQGTLLRSASVCLLLAGSVAMADDSTVPEKWDAAATSAPEGAETASRCGATEADLRRMVSNAGSNGTVTRGPSERTKPYLAVNGTKVTCVNVTPKGYPLVEVFNQTIEFEGMMTDTVKALRASLARQLGTRGVATALVKNEKGNALQVTYLFAQERPTRLYYQASFLRAGEFDEGRFEAVFTSPGGWGMTSRGGTREQFRSLFAD